MTVVVVPQTSNELTLSGCIKPGSNGLAELWLLDCVPRDDPEEDEVCRNGMLNREDERSGNATRPLLVDRDVVGAASGNGPVKPMYSCVGDTNAVSCDEGLRTNPILDSLLLSASMIGLRSDKGLTGDTSLKDRCSGANPVSL